MTLATLEADAHMLRLNVLVKDINRGGKAAFSALPACLSLHHPRPDQAIRRLVHLIPEKASCSKNGKSAKAKLLQVEPILRKAPIGQLANQSQISEFS